MTPYFEGSGVTIYHGDCREVAPLLSGVTAVVSDPPYGIAWDTDSRRFGGGWTPGVERPPMIGDAEPFDPRPWLGFRRVVLWGANHYAQHLPPGTWLAWIKREDHNFGQFLSDAELGWMKGGYGVYCHRKPFRPPQRAQELGRQLGKRALPHPTQKPLSLMGWCLERAKVVRGDVVLDPYMGTGTTLAACAVAGIPAIGIEREEEYCAVAASRLKQRTLFA